MSDYHALERDVKWFSAECERDKALKERDEARQENAKLREARDAAITLLRDIRGYGCWPQTILDRIKAFCENQQPAQVEQGEWVVVKLECPE